MTLHAWILILRESMKISQFCMDRYVSLTLSRRNPPKIASQTGKCCICSWISAYFPTKFYSRIPLEKHLSWFTKFIGSTAFHRLGHRAAPWSRRPARQPSAPAGRRCRSAGAKPWRWRPTSLGVVSWLWAKSGDLRWVHRQWMVIEEIWIRNNGGCWPRNMEIYTWGPGVRDES